MILVELWNQFTWLTFTFFEGTVKMYCTLPKYHEHFKETLFSECNCESISVLPHRNQTVSHPENTAKVMSLSKGTSVLTRHISSFRLCQSESVLWCCRQPRGIQPKQTCRWGLLFPLKCQGCPIPLWWCSIALWLLGKYDGCSSRLVWKLLIRHQDKLKE